MEDSRVLIPRRVLALSAMKLQLGVFALLLTIYTQTKYTPIFAHMRASVSYAVQPLFTHYLHTQTAEDADGIHTWPISYYWSQENPKYSHWSPMLVQICESRSGISHLHVYLCNILHLYVHLPKRGTWLISICDGMSWNSRKHESKHLELESGNWLWSKYFSKSWGFSEK